MKSVTRWILPMVFAAALASTGHSAQAASFDCVKAATPTEKAICRDPALSRLDGEVGAAFGAALGASPAAGWPALIRRDQRQWLKVRDTECKADLACLKRDYEIRLTFLRRPDLKYMGRYVAGACPHDGHYLDVTPSYPAPGVEVLLYLCPDPAGNVLMQGAGKVDASGRLVFDDAGCPRTLRFSGDVLTIEGAAPGRCAPMTEIRSFRRDPTKSPFEGEDP